MSDRAPRLVRLTAIAAALALSACDRGTGENELAKLDNRIAGNDVDPALTSALQDQILVDPTLTNQSNRNAVRPPETPRQAQYPAPAQGAPAARTAQARQSGQGGATSAVAPQPQRASAQTGGTACAGNAPFNYHPSWAGRLPAAFAGYPGARITEAAGNDQGDCRVRVLTFTTRDAPGRVLAWYRDRATRAGYSAEQQKRGADFILGGTSQSDGGAYYVIATPLRAGGSDVALIANNGR